MRVARLWPAFLLGALLWVSPAWAGQWIITSEQSGTAEADYIRPLYTSNTSESVIVDSGLITPPPNETHGSQDLHPFDQYY